MTATHTPTVVSATGAAPTSPLSKAIGNLRTASGLIDALVKVSASLITLGSSYFALVGHGREQIAGLAVVLVAVTVLIWRLWQSKTESIAVPEVPAIRGLAPFNENDAECLRGRNNEIGTLRGLIEDGAWPVVLVLGAPSSGKTSLLRAGLVPMLDAPRWIPVYAVATERTDLLDDIRRKVAQHANCEVGDRPLVELITHCAEVTGRTPVIICDQLERLFTSDERQVARLRLFDAIRACLDRTTANTRFVVSMRSGFDAGVRELTRRLDEITVIPEGAQVLVERFKPDQAVAVLKQIADHDNTPFASNLCSGIVDDLTRDGTVCPAELQVVANWLRKLGITNRPAYEGIGRARGLFWQRVRTVAESVDSVTSLGAARYLLTMLSDRALEVPAASLSRQQLVDRSGDPRLATGVLGQESLDAALRHLIEDDLVIQVAGGDYQLIHPYFARDIRVALDSMPSPWLRMWWRTRQMVATYSLPAAAAVGGLLIVSAAAALIWGAPGARPRWTLSGQAGFLDNGAPWAFDPQNAHLAVDDGTRLVVWDLLPDRLLALDTPPREPLRTVGHPPKDSGTQGRFLPTSVGFLADGSEAYEVWINELANRWRIDRVPVAGAQAEKSLEGDLTLPQGKTTCSVNAAAWSRKLDTMAVAYDCGQIVLLPSGLQVSRQVREIPNDADPTCEPKRVALNASEEHLVVAYRCLSATEKQQSKLRTWVVGPNKDVPREWGNGIFLKEAEDNNISELTFRWDGHVTVGFGTLAEHALYDVSTKPPTPLAHNSSNAADPRLVWLGPDGRVAAVQEDSNPELQLNAVDLWLGPIRVPPFLPFRASLSDVLLNF
jgi:hypothetical protein